MLEVTINLQLIIVADYLWNLADIYVCTMNYQQFGKNVNFSNDPGYL